MNNTRRLFLKGSIAGSVVAVAVGAGLLTPRAVMAAWPKDAFGAKSQKDATMILTGAEQGENSAQIEIKAPDIAENGSVVPITVETSIANAESISVMVLENAFPLAINYELTDGVTGYGSTRVKMGKTSDVVAVVKAGGKVYSTTKSVKVTLGGCGG